MRIQVKDADQPTLQEMQQATGLPNASDVLTLLLRKYGRDFINWFSSEGASPPPPNLPPVSTSEFTPVFENPSENDDLPPIEF